MRALAIPTALGGFIIMWACFAPAEKAASDSDPTTRVASPIVITVDTDNAQPADLAAAASEPDSPTLDPRSDWKAYIDLQRAEVSAISTQIERVRQESATVVNDLLARRQMHVTGRADLKTARSLTDRRFQEWQDRDQDLQQAIERFEELSKSLSDHQEHPGAAVSVIGKAALECLTASDGYRDAGNLWSEAVQSECQLCTNSSRDRSAQTETDIELVPATTKTAAATGQQAMRFAECGERKMDSYQDTVRFTRRVRTLKVVGPLHKVDSLSLANQKLYSDVRQVANSLTKDLDISPERLAFLNNKLKTLKDQIARNTKELDAASKGVRIYSPCASGRCSK